jgi:mitogen-activated protein kinase kinase
MSILELLHHIVNEPAPRLVSRSREFPESATTFIEGCLNKEPNTRQSPQELLVRPL